MHKRGEPVGQRGPISYEAVNSHFAGISAVQTENDPAKWPLPHGIPFYRTPYQTSIHPFRINLLDLKTGKQRIEQYANLLNRVQLHRCGKQCQKGKPKSKKVKNSDGTETTILTWKCRFKMSFAIHG